MGLSDCFIDLRLLRNRIVDSISSSFIPGVLLFSVVIMLPGSTVS